MRMPIVGGVLSVLYINKYWASEKTTGWYCGLSLYDPSGLPYTQGSIHILITRILSCQNAVTWEYSLCGASFMLL